MLKDNEIVILDIYLFTFGVIYTTTIPNIPPCLNSGPYSILSKKKIVPPYEDYETDVLSIKNFLRAQTKIYISKPLICYPERASFAAYFLNQLATFSIKCHLSRYCHYLINI